MTGRLRLTVRFSCVVVFLVRDYEFCVPVFRHQTFSKYTVSVFNLNSRIDNVHIDFVDIGDVWRVRAMMIVFR